MPGCKAPEDLRSEAYDHVRRNDEGQGKRRRWAFFINRLIFYQYGGYYRHTDTKLGEVLLGLIQHDLDRDPLNDFNEIPGSVFRGEK